MLRYPFLVLTAVVASAVSVRGQDNPLSTEAKSDYKVVKNFVIQAAEKVPEAGYSFKPTPEVRSLASSSDTFPMTSTDTARRRSGRANPQFEKAPPPKAEMVAALKSAFAYCDTAYETLVDASATENVVFLGRTIPKLIVFTLHAGHAWEHYGNEVVYMGLQGIIPPPSEKAGK